MTTKTVICGVYPCKKRSRVPLITQSKLSSTKRNVRVEFDGFSYKGRIRRREHGGEMHPICSRKPYCVQRKLTLFPELSELGVGEKATGSIRET